MALPLSINDAWTAFLKMPINMRLPFVLAYKTASRWDDIRGLRWEDLRPCGRDLTLVIFRRTKTNVAGRPRIDHVVLIASTLLRLT